MGKLFKTETAEVDSTMKEGIAYLIFGVLTTAVDYVISNVLFYLSGMGPVAAQTVGWTAAVLFAFVTNKWWVFNSRTLVPSEVWKEFLSFILCRVVTFLFNLAAIVVMVDWMGIEFFISKLVISVAVIILNYIFSKVLIFAKKKEEK